MKRLLYSHFCLKTEEKFDNCIFIDESKIELEVHARQR